MTSSGDTKPPKRRQLTRALRNLAIAVGLTLLLFVLLEGVSSTLLLVWRLGSATGRSRNVGWVHTRFDEYLGWANEPNLKVEDVYGPGNDLTTNSQGFRATIDFETAEPQGKLRVICSGDSFTLGHGVGDADTWCARLAGIDPRLETVNMGQLGYGVGQVYLWYMRDGRPLEHSIHILAVISMDFRRMMEDRFIGFEKPRLALEEEGLVVENVPLRPRRIPLTRLEVEEQINDLRLVQVSRGILRRLGDLAGGTDTVTAEPSVATDSSDIELMVAILDSVVAVNDAKGSTFVVAFIPTRDDMGKALPDRTTRWLRFLSEESDARGFLFVNLLDRFANEYPDRLYIPFGRQGRGHLTAYGNSVVAEEIHRQLMSVPRLSERLSALPPPATPDP